MLTSEQALKAIENMTVLELIALTKQLEQQWGVEAKPQAVQYIAPPVNPKLEEKTEFDVILVSVPADKKIAVIKALREILVLGLLECKQMIEALPKTLKEAISSDDAERIKQTLMDCGAVVEVR